MSQKNKNNNAELYQKITELFEGAVKNTKENKTVKSKENSQTIDEVKQTFGIYNKIVDIYQQSSENNEKIKKRYSILLIFILLIQLAITNFIFYKIGVGVLNYSESVVKLYLTGTLAEVFALVTIIVKYTFSDNLSKSLDTILNKSAQIENKQVIVRKPNNIDENNDEQSV